MSGSLAHRFTYGSGVPSGYSGAEADLVLGVPARQRELLQLTRAQIAIGEQTIETLETSSQELGLVIQNEIRLQTRSLVETMREGADAVAAAIDNLGNRLSAELVGIRWELHQVRHLSKQILQVLKRPRSTEAKELLQQGIRNLVNDKLEQAENRFLLALDRDHTDYQVLMNLSAVELRKGDAARAMAYVKDALALPANLDSGARADALWWLARLHYAVSEFDAAAATAKQALAVVSEPRRLFQHGVYEILATQGASGFAQIELSIQQDPSLFALASVETDLSDFRKQAESLLESLSHKALADVRALRDELCAEAPSVSKLSRISQELLRAVPDAIAEIEAFLGQPSYSGAVEILSRAGSLRSAPRAFRTLNQAEGAFIDATEERDRAVREFERLKAKLAMVSWAGSSTAWGCGLPVLFLLSMFALSFASYHAKIGHWKVDTDRMEFLGMTIIMTTAVLVMLGCSIATWWLGRLVARGGLEVPAADQAVAAARDRRAAAAMHAQQSLGKS